MSKVKEGIVKWLNNSKGYGFLTPSNGGKFICPHEWNKNGRV